MSNGINNLNIPTINGLQNLSLDNLDVGTIDGDLFYIDRIEATEIILDHKLTMNNNTWINTNGTTITNIELSYLDNCNSNIQTQINNVNTGNTSLQNQINTHTTQITNLQNSDTTQNTTLTTHTNQITALQTSDTAQNTAINNINYAIYGQSTNITNLQTSDTTQNATLATHTSQITALQTSDTTQNTTLTTHTSQITALQTSDTDQNNSISIQNGRILTLQTSDDAQSASIYALETKTQNFTADTAKTLMTKRLHITTNGDNMRLIGSFTTINAYAAGGTSLDWSIGQPSTNSKKLQLINYKQDATNIISGINASGLYGRNDVNIYSNGIKFYRGDSTQSGNTLEYSGGIGQLNPSLSHFFIAGNSTNPIYIDAGLSSITLNSNTIWISGQTTAGNGRYSNINMLNSAGNAWETQSSAFTETLKQQIITNQNNITTLQTNVTALQTSLTNSKTSIARINYSNGNSFLLGRSTTLTANFNYPTLTFTLKVGPLLYSSGYSAFFNSNGNWIYNSSQRVNFQFDMEFNGLDTGVKAMVSRFVVTSSSGSALIQSSRQGVRYNAGTGNPLYTTLYYSTGNFVFDISYGDIVSIETENWFSTSSLGASVTTTGRLTFYLSQF